MTRLQPFIIGGDSFHEQVEALISYNVWNDGQQQDCLYIEQGHLTTPTSFLTDGYQSSAKHHHIMDTDTFVFYTVAGIPALVSTRITVLYFILKLLNYFTNAGTDKAPSRETTSTHICEQKYSGKKGIESDLEIQ